MKSVQQLRYPILIVVMSFLCLVGALPASFRALTMDNGLSNFVVTALFRDSVGFVWIGTDNSLDRFDGVGFRHYTFPGGDINKKRVRSIAETNTGEVYAGNGLGLWKVNKYSSELEQVFSEQIEGSVNALLWNPTDKQLYIGSDRGLYIYRAGKSLQFVALTQNALSGMNNVQGFTTDERGDLWITTLKGLCRYEIKTGKISGFDYTTDSSDQSNFSKLTRIGSTLYIATSRSGIIRFDRTTSAFSKYTDVGSDIITDISGDGSSTLYVATDGNGVHFINHQSGQIVRSIRYEPKQKSGIRSNSVYSLLVDRDGVIWVGFYQAGLDYSLMQNDLFTCYAFPPFFDSTDLPVRTFLIRENDKLIGTREGLYYIQESQRHVSVFDRTVLRSNLVLSLVYHKGDYYIGTYGGGVSVLPRQGRSVRPLSNQNTLLKGHVFHFEEDKKGSLWIATSGGLYRYKKEKNDLQLYNHTNSQLPVGNVYYVFFDSSGRGWIATEKGLFIYDPESNTIKSDVFPKGFFNKEIIKVIYEDSKGKLFFCPDKGNIYTSDRNMRNFSNLSMTRRFQGRIFLSVLEDKQHNYWFGSDHGLISMKGTTDTYHSFGFIDGIPDPVFTTDAAYQDEKGTLWFGNAKGLLFVNPAKIDETKQKTYPIQFTGFLVNGVEPDPEITSKVAHNNSLQLSYNQDNLKIGFVSLLFTNPATLVYEYKLEGYDQEWQVTAAGDHEVSYSDLKSGNYTFRVRVEGNKESEALLHITIRSFFSLTFWLIAGTTLLLLYFLASKLILLYKKLISKIYKLTMSQTQEEKQDEKYKYTKVGEQECQQVCTRLYAYMDTGKPYIHPDLKLADLARELHTSTHTLSYIFNQHLNKTYYDFINEYRINEFKRLINDSDVARYTLSALAEQCGFSSRASFFRSFKKLTGITPNEYIRSLGKSINTSDN